MKLAIRDRETEIAVVDTADSKKELETRMRALLRAVKFGDVTLPAAAQQMQQLWSDREDAVLGAAKMAITAVENELRIRRSIESLKR